MNDYNLKTNKEELAKRLAKYEDTLKKLRELGLNVNPSRLKKYVAPYKKLISNWGAETIREIITNKSYASALFEIHQVIEIGEKLLEFEDHDLTASLRKIISGGELYSVDSKKDKTNHSRNFSFELFMARYFKRAGYQLNFNTIADINAIDDIDSIFIECKRPANVETVGRNIEKALKQAIKRFDTNEPRNQKGIAAIDLTALINPEQEFFVSNDLSIISNKTKEVEQLCAPVVRNLFEKYGNDCLSVMFYCCFPVFQLKDESIGIYDRCFSVPIYVDNTLSEEVFTRLNHKLMESVGK